MSQSTSPVWKHPLVWLVVVAASLWAAGSILVALSPILSPFVLAGMLASGALVSVVDRVLPLAQTADALRYYLSGAAPGKVVVTA